MSSKSGTGRQAGGNNLGMQGIKKLSMDTNKVRAADPAAIMAQGRQSSVKPTSVAAKKIVRNTKAR